MKYQPPLKAMQLPVPEKPAIPFDCIYGCGRKADLLHRGTAYCRPCYDDRNRIGALIN